MAYDYYEKGKERFIKEKNCDESLYVLIKELKISNSTVHHIRSGRES